MSTPASYPVRVEGHLEPRLSRWLWLVKWMLAVPHCVVLAFLWMAFGVLSAVAFIAILFTGRYPESILEFNVGVLRWSWRVAYYSYGALGTDRYPPFTLADVPDYPARLEVARPGRLSRGLVLVKWLLAIPHFLVVGLFVGGAWIAWQTDRTEWSLGGGLIGLLVLVAGVVLAASGRYPTSLFDLILGLNRWVLRVAAYAALMTDVYPPFRLDLGGDEPAGTLTVPPPPTPGGAPGGPLATAGTGAASAEPGAGRTAGGRWTTGRIVAVVVGALLIVSSAGMLAGGGVAMWADRTQRDGAGYVGTGWHGYAAGGYALAVRSVDLRAAWGIDWTHPSSILGTVRLRVAPAGGGGPLFVGIGRSTDVARYLAGIRHSVIEDAADPTGAIRALPGGAPATLPAAQRIWVASSAGAGVRTLVWRAQPGTWSALVMNADGGAGLDVRASVAATVPALGAIAGVLLGVGALLLVAGAVLVGVAASRASRGRPEAAPPAPGDAGGTDR